MDNLKPINTDFIILPLNKADLFLVYRFDGSSYKRLLVNYKDLVNSISSLIQGNGQLTLKVNGVNNIVQNVLNLVDGLNTTVVDNGDGSVKIDVSAGGTGTVTSVTVTASNALSASGNPITTSGTITLNWTGNNSQFVRGDGTLATILTNLSQFVNDVGFITSSALAPYLTISSAAATYTPLTNTIQIQGVTQSIGSNPIFSFPSLPFKGGMYTEQVFQTTAGPLSVLYVPTVNKVYACIEGSNVITIFNAITGELTNTLALNGANSIFYVSNTTTPEIWAFASAAGVNTRINRINITPVVGGESIFATLIGLGTVVAIGQPNDVLEVTSTKNYISQYGSNSIAIIDPTVPSLTGTIAAVGSNPVGLALNNNGASAMNGTVVSGNVNGITIINSSTDTITALSVNPSSLLLNVRYIRYIPSLDVYAVASGGTQRLVILQPATSTTFTVLASIRGIGGISDIFYNATDNCIYVSHIAPFYAATLTQLMISVIDMSTYQVVNAYPTGIAGGTGSYRSNMSNDPASRRFFTTFISAVGNAGFAKIKY